MPTVNKYKLSGLKTYFRLLSYVKNYWLYFIPGVLFTAAASGIAAGFTWFLKPLLNEGFISRDVAFIKWVPFIVIAAYLGLGITGFLGDYFIAWVARHVVMTLQREIFKKYLKLPLSFFQKHSSGQLIARLIYNIEQIAEASSTVAMTIFKDVFYGIGLIVVMLINSVLLTFIFFITVPFILIVATFTGKIMKRLSLQVQDSVADISHIAKETTEGGEVVANFGGQKYETSKFNKATQTICKKQIQIAIANSLGTATARMIASIAITISIYLATTPAHSLSAGAFMATIAAMFSILKPLRNLTDINNLLQKGIAGAETVFEILDESEEEDSGVKTLANVKGAIRYEHVDFSYPASHKTVLKDINFEVQPGQTVAIVGRSGSGKSTLVNLLPRFYDCQKGDIYLDDINIRNISLSSLRSQVSVVSQHITLFNDSVIKNIAYGRLDNISKTEVYSAAESAHALEFIDELPNGFDTIIGENGVLLSGGERQRIAIARALLKNAPILILDEATSVLDNESEKYIQAALANLMHNKTTLVIAHRLSTIRNADMILVLDKGKIVEFGTHRELLAKNKSYAKLSGVV